MSGFDNLLMWFHLFKEAQKIKEYEDLNSEFDVFISKIGGNRVLTEEEDIEFYELIQTQWKRIIADKSDELEEKIRKRLTKGQTFSSIHKEINKIRRKGEKNLKIEEYYELYKDLMGIEKDVEEKISIERFQILLFITGLILGYLIKKYIG